MHVPILYMLREFYSTINEIHLLSICYCIGRKENIRENYGGKKCSYCHKNNAKITKTTFEIMIEMNRENLIVTTNRQKMMREKKLVCITTICVTKTKSRINKTTTKKLAIMSKNKMVYRVRF